jgi:hypothetical protein
MENLKYELKKKCEYINENDLEKLIKQEKCLICENMDMIREYRLMKCTVNCYNENVRGLVCNTCDIFERNVRNAIENEWMSWDKLYNKFDRKKLENVINVLYIGSGIIPMMVEYI